MRTLQYLFDKEYNQMEKVDVSQIPDEITVEYLADITKKMRHAQRRYFATRNKDVLAESKRLEALVDAVISKLYDTQMTLF